MKEEARNWLKQAEADLRTSQNSLKSKDYYASVFWSQQVVEKCLKAAIIENKGELAKIHDLVILGRMADLPKDLLKECEKISGVYTESRYGILDSEIPAEKFNEKDSLDSISIAREILIWAKKTLKL
ncbi:MAG: HEPN domain-containing protein [Nanoarchaeota archaeon]